MSTHTPGPWVMSGDGTIEARGLGLVGHVKNMRDSDRALITAAPDMLEALQALVRAVKQFTNADAMGWPELEQAKAAIVKATGETA